MWAWIVFRLLPVVSQVLRTTFFYVLAGASLFFALQAQGAPLVDVGGFVVTQPVAVVTATVLIVIYTVHGLRHGGKARFQNHDVATRVLHLSELIGSCEHELFMVTGELDHTVYDNPTLVAAFASIPATASVEIFITKGDIDPRSLAIKRLIKKRGWRVYLAPPKLGHVIIVDRAHIRIERPDGANAPAIRHALYEYGATDLAAGVRRRVMRVIDYKRVYRVRIDEDVVQAGERAPLTPRREREAVV